MNMCAKEEGEEKEEFEPEIRGVTDAGQITLPKRMRGPRYYKIQKEGEQIVLTPVKDDV